MAYCPLSGTICHWSLANCHLSFYETSQNGGRLHAMTRRDALRLLPIAVSFSFPRQNNMPRPFKVDIPQATVNRILARVKETRLPDRLDSTDWRYGANWNYMKSLAEYWVTHFDW